VYIKVELTRDSVCMADDIQDNTKTLNIKLQSDISATILTISKEYLPAIAGRGHSWNCFLNGEIVAVIHGNCIRSTVLNDESNFTIDSKLYFQYRSATF